MSCVKISLLFLQVSVWKEPNYLKNVGYRALGKSLPEAQTTVEQEVKGGQAEIATASFSLWAWHLHLLWLLCKTKAIVSKGRWSCGGSAWVSRSGWLALRPSLAIAHFWKYTFALPRDHNSRHRDGAWYLFLNGWMNLVKRYVREFLLPQ